MSQASSSRERVLAALELREPDRVPTFDLMMDSISYEIIGKKPSPVDRLLASPASDGFPRHYYSKVGDLEDKGEEFLCAQYIDRMDEVDFWVRNLDRQPTFSFWLQTSTDKFYPDFVCKLKDGRYLVVEYKGADRWSNDDSKEKRRLGELWALKSGGKCLFVMPKGKDWGAIKAVVSDKS